MLGSRPGVPGVSRSGAVGALIVEGRRLVVATMNSRLSAYARSRLGRALPILAAAAIALAAYGFGYWQRDNDGFHPPSITAACRTSANLGSCEAGNVTYGFDGVVPWIGPNGSLNLGTWPTCLPNDGELVDVRIGAAWIWTPHSGALATVLWVDCEGK
jgi:hypothetical protein